MKKIAVITTGFSKFLAGGKYGGGEVVLKNLIFELMNKVSLYVFTPDNEEIISQLKLKFPNIKFRSYNKSPFSYEYIDELKQIFNIENFDKIINFNMVVPYETTILQSHSYLHKLNKVFIIFRPLKKYILRHKIKIQQMAFKRAVNDANYIAVSNKIKDDYCKNFGIPENKIQVIYPGVKIEEFEENIQNLQPAFGIVANSSINKGGHYLLTALGILNLLNKKFKLKIIAPKYNHDILMKFIINILGLKKKVEVLSFQNDMKDFYKNIDILVLPSVNEAFGLVTLEAMERGKLVIVSSTAGCSEIIDETNGIIFNRKSFLDFLKKLNFAINLYNKGVEKYKNITVSARKTAEKYSWEIFSLKVIDGDE